MSSEQPRVYSYLRFSGKKQEKGDSLRRQTSLRDSWLARRGWTLDESLVLPDKAISAFRGKNLTDGLLGWFIKECQAGRVPKGSYLVIEKIDRFTRFDPDEALPIFTNLVKKLGIIIVTLEPEKEWTAASVQGFGCMELLVHLMTGHEESKKKSERLANCWKEKKRNAEQKKLLTPKVPTWLKCVDIDRTDNRFRGGRLIVNEEKAAIVRRIFDLAEKGHGASQIAVMLNKDETPTLAEWGRLGWHGSAISKILRNRAVVGEYQPCRITPEGPKRRVPDGEPIPDFYPAIIKEAQWLRVQQALDGRKNARGKVGRNVSNLFSGLVYHAKDGGRLFLKALPRSAYFTPSNQRFGLTEHKFSFSYSSFEHAFLSFFHEVTPADLQPTKEAKDETEIMLVRVAELDRKIEQTEAKIAQNPDIGPLLNVLTKLDSERKALLAKLSKASRSKAANAKQELTEGMKIIDLLASTSGEKLLDLRARLKAIIRSLVESIYVIVEPWGEGKVCIAQVFFKNGGCRDISILSAGKGVGKIRGVPVDLCAGTRYAIYRDENGVAHKRLPPPAFDMRKYQEEKYIRHFYEGRIETLQNSSPLAIAVRRMKAGEVAYRVAKDMGISMSTIYKWRSEM